MKLKKPAVTQSLTIERRYHSQVCYKLCTGLLWLMAVLVDIGVFRGLVSETYGS